LQDCCSVSDVVRYYSWAQYLLQPIRASRCMCGAVVSTSLTSYYGYLVDYPSGVVYILVVSVCLSVYLSVCLSDDNFRQPWRMEVRVCTCGIFPRSTDWVRVWWSLGQGQGHRSQKRRKFVFLQCKTSIGSNSRSIRHIELWCLCVAWDFRVWRIEWCNSHCHVTRSEHA